ncbi:hypothetical protein [Dialister invisus]|nr:hypothetical protein [Dialister invisus]
MVETVLCFHPIVPQKEEESNRKKNHAASRFSLMKSVRMVRR